MTDRGDRMGGSSIPGAPSAQAVYFGPDNRKLFGWYHAPSGATVRRGAVVLCGPLAYESTGWHRALRHWATALADAGVPALRFDYHGMGDSSGCTDDSDRVQSWLGSVGSAVDLVKEISGAKTVTLAGVRVGGTFALAAAATRDDVDALILWATFPTGKAYLREGRAFTHLMGSTVEPSSDGSEQLGGFVLGAQTVADLALFDPLAPERKLTQRILLISRDETSHDTPFVNRLTAVGGSVEHQSIAGYEDVMVDAHQSAMPDQLFTRTATWVADLYQPFPLGDAPVPPVRPPDAPMALASCSPIDGGAPGAEICEQPVHFGEQGHLFGILSRPAVTVHRRTGIVLPNAGSVHRVGPNRVYVDLAREWAGLGYVVLRMDLGGLGDSGVPPRGEENHTYPEHAVSDVASAIEVLRSAGCDRVVVAGLCSGAHTGFHAGIELEGIDGLLIVNPIVFYWKPSDPLDVASWVNFYDVQHYKQSLRRSGSWVRLFQGKVNAVHVARVALTRMGQIITASVASLVRRFHHRDATDSNVARDLSRMAARGTDVLLLFNAGDPGLDFLKLNYHRELKELERAGRVRLVVIDDADHTFTALRARRRAQSALTDHLRARHA